MFRVMSPKGYLQRPGLRAEVGEIIRPLATHIQILTSPRAWQAVNPQLTISLERAGISWQLDFLSGECTDAAIADLHQRVLTHGTSLILAIGGGRVLDCAKAVNDALPAVRLVNMATVAATCAAWSPLAIIYNQQGGHLRSQPLSRMPEWILVDSEVIAASDVRYLRAGMVDALAKWIEFEPYQRQRPHQLALDLKVNAARQALEWCDRWGEAAVAANIVHQVTPALEKIIEANIVLAGLANSVQDSLATPGFAHVIHDRLTHQPELHHWLHGEKVGFSLLVHSFIEQDNGKVEPELLALLRRFHTPLTLPAGISDARVRQIAREIHFPAASLADLPFTIDPLRLEQALLATAAFKQ